MNSFSLNGKTALIYGCDCEISKATACALAVSGARVIVIDSDTTSFKAFEDALGADGFSIKSIEIKPNNLSEEIDNILKKYGRIDILVNNPGARFSQANSEIQNAQWDMMVTHGLSQAFAAIKAVVPRMKKAGFGRIVNISSYAARIGFGFTGIDFSVYNAGMTSMTRQLALTYAGTGINFNAVAPGPLEGKGACGYNDAELSDILKKTPLKKLCKPEEVAAAVLYLCCDESNYVTGETMNINGGFYMV
ncbi:MAG: SDR family oxidoreductase [Oscillospiraceae bacterium]|nr:SDR family oxidoreductase [Oscillospiraceae bacterium]